MLDNRWVQRPLKLYTRLYALSPLNKPCKTFESVGVHQYSSTGLQKLAIQNEAAAFSRYVPKRTPSGWRECDADFGGRLHGIAGALALQRESVEHFHASRFNAECRPTSPIPWDSLDSVSEQQSRALAIAAPADPGRRCWD